MILPRRHSSDQGHDQPGAICGEPGSEPTMLADEANDRAGCGPGPQPDKWSVAQMVGGDRACLSILAALLVGDHGVRTIIDPSGN
jgi:hypothetical protein